MIVTLELADRKEAALRAKAQAHGVSAEQYVQQIIDRDLEETGRDARSVWDLFAENRKRVPPEEFAKLPKDGADEHDHHLYGQAFGSSLRQRQIITSGLDLYTESAVPVLTPRSSYRSRSFSNKFA